MDKEKQNIFWFGVSMVVFMGLIPPWCQHGPGAFIQPGSYAPIFLPPAGCVIDTDRLLLQWFLIALVCAAWLLTGRPSNKVSLVVATIMIGWTTVTACFTFHQDKPAANPFANTPSTPAADPFANLPPYK